MNGLVLAAVLVAVGCAVVLLLVIIRLLRPPPTFPTWQPGYIYRAVYDPKSTRARRQAWQPSAQQDILPPDGAVGGYVARKLLIGIEGEKFVGWRVHAARLCPYDAYGRVTRFSVIASDSILNALGYAREQSPALTEARARRLLRSAARRLARQYARRVRGSGAAVLPISFDFALTGDPEQAVVQFELCRRVPSGWVVSDRWDADLNAGSLIYEQLSYPLYGRLPHEDDYAFANRLEADLLSLWVAIFMPLPKGDFGLDDALDEMLWEGIEGEKIPLSEDEERGSRRHKRFS